MRKGILAATLMLGLLPLSPVNAQPDKPILAEMPKKVMIGDRWKTGRKRTQYVEVMVNWADWETPEVDMRHPHVNTEKSTLHNEAFPLIVKTEVYFAVQAIVTISREGTVTACRFDPDTPVDPDMRFDPIAKTHICPLLMRSVRFYPALDKAGQLVERTGVVSATYSVVKTKPARLSPPSMIRPATKNANGRAEKPDPIEDITFETLGLKEETLKGISIDTIFAQLRIDVDGKALNCRIGAATYVDALDRQICSKAMALKFRAGLGEDGNPREDDFFLILLTSEILAE